MKSITSGNSPQTPAASAVEMRWIPGGSFTMGADGFYPEESPTRRVQVDGFWIDETPVTNAQFARFVDATGYITQAEIAPRAEDFPDADREQLRAGSLLFVPPGTQVRLDDVSQWWAWCIGASWRTPYGPDSDLRDLGDHPVVHIVHADAVAYAKWAGKVLPSEAEWEFAARGGQDGLAYAWGSELTPGGKVMANYWQGHFPWLNSLEDGYLRTSPVRSYPANGYGLFDMIGNVWEWTDDWYAAGEDLPFKASACCATRNPRGATEAQSIDPRGGPARMGRRVLKGGSHLCSEDYCQRFRPAARHPQAIDTSTSHVGFRCIRRSAVAL